MTGIDRPGAAVEVRPEVVFLSELLEELTKGKIRIPRFQRPFVWRRDQMTDLLDSVYNQYPIGSLLVWETSEPIATLDHLGPFKFEQGVKHSGYLLDGHQRLSTLAGALLSRRQEHINKFEQDRGRWNLVWNMSAKRFQHGKASDDYATLFPLTSLLDTLDFFQAIDRVKVALAQNKGLAERYIQDVSRLARAFQHYRVPVIRIRQTSLSQAVEIFARLNSKGQSMSADQMVSALTYKQVGHTRQFDLATEIDTIVEDLGERNFGDIDRTAILRAVLANIDEDIYRTDWTRLASGKREDLGKKLDEGVLRAKTSLQRAINFLGEIGVTISRLLPYAMQVVAISAFFDTAPTPTDHQLYILRRWFWASSFSGWFGGANPSRVNSLVTQLRRFGQHGELDDLSEQLSLNIRALPFPATFDMRSARTRSLLLVMLSASPRFPNGEIIPEPWTAIAERGPSGVGHIFVSSVKGAAGSPANRMIRPPGVNRGIMKNWISSELQDAKDVVLGSHGLNREAVDLVRRGDVDSFIEVRQRYLIGMEKTFMNEVGVIASKELVGEAPVDTD